MQVVDRDRPPVPMTILTGFLGGGKTTLLNRILTGEHGLRVGVLVNDFGSVNIDAELVVGVDGGAVSLANGCVCCDLRDDLVGSVSILLERPEAVEYIVLEASGVADPGGIFMTFNDPDLRDRVTLDGVICVLDAEQVFAYPEYPALIDLKLRQVGFADMVIVNKVSLAGVEQVSKVRGWLDGCFNRLRVVETDYCKVPYPILLGIGRVDPAQVAMAISRSAHSCIDLSCHNEDHEHGHSNLFSTLSYETDRPLSLAALREALRTLPGTVYRVKGIVYSADVPQHRVLVQVVGRRVDISVHEEWAGRPPRTRVVAIGAAGSLDNQLLEEAFTSCIATAAEPGGMSTALDPAMGQ